MATGSSSPGSRSGTPASSAVSRAPGSSRTLKDPTHNLAHHRHPIHVRIVTADHTGVDYNPGRLDFWLCIVACGIHVGSDAANEVAGEESEVLKAVQLLLKVGTDVNAIDANGDTAMHAAALKNLSKVAQVLTQCLNELFINRNLPCRLLDMARA